MFIFLFPVTKDAAANTKARTGLQQLVKLAADAGFGEYRCAPAYQDPHRTHLLIQQQCATALSRDAEGCDRPQRHSLSGALRHLAASLASKPT